MSRSIDFDKIYNNGLWNDNIKTIPLSGPGSSLTNTLKYRELLDNITDELNIKSIVDVGCGDLTWMPYTNTFKMCKYTGIDIVKSLIESHSITHIDKSFLCMDAVVEDVPCGDLVILRDILFHLSHEDVINLLNNIKGKFKYYMITSSNNTVNNDMFNKYHFHELNVRIHPFNLKSFKVMLTEPEFNRDILLFDHQFLSQ